MPQKQENGEVEKPRRISTIRSLRVTHNTQYAGPLVGPRVADLKTAQKSLNPGVTMTSDVMSSEQHPPNDRQSNIRTTPTRHNQTIGVGGRGFDRGPIWAALEQWTQVYPRFQG